MMRLALGLAFALAAGAPCTSLLACGVHASDWDGGAPAPGSVDGGGESGGIEAGGREAGGSDAGASDAGGGEAGASEAGDHEAGGCSYTAPITQTLPQGPTLFENSYAYYPRVIRLEHSGTSNGTLVVTVVRQNTLGHWVGHLARSTDGGLTFSALGDVDDPMAAGGMCCQTLFELPVAIGAMPAGTLLWAATFGADVKPNPRTSVRVWQSPDGGKSWSFLSTVATSSSNFGLWEPEFTVSADGHLVVFYSDETDPAYSQKLVAWRSTDGAAWTDFQAVVAASPWALRPGMANVRKTPDGNWLMSYEVCSQDGSHPCEVHVRSSPEGWSWGDPASLGTNVQLADGEFPASSPTLTVAGKTVLLKAMRQRNADMSFAAGDGKQIFANANDGHGAWFAIPAPVPMTDPGMPGQQPGYSNPLLGSADGKAVFHMATDYGADGTLHAYYASSPIAPAGGSSAAEGTQTLVAGGASQFFARSSAGTLERWLPGGPGATWATGSTTLAGEPAALVFQTQEDVFARTSAAELSRRYVDTSTDAGAEETWGTGISSDPAALVVGDALHAWAADAAGALQHWWWSAAQGLQHDTWAQGVTGRPSAVLDSDVQHVFARTPSGGLTHVWWDGGQGLQQESIEAGATGVMCSPLPPLASDPVASILGGAQHVWAIDDAGALQHLWWNPGQPWRYETWGTGLAGRPTIMQVGDAEHTFARSTAGALQHWWWNPAQGLQHDTWSGAVTIAGDPVSLLDGATQEAFALDASGTLQHWSWSAATGVVHDSWGP